MDGKSMDLTQSNIESLRKMFPEIIVENKVDFEKLKLLLGKEIEDNDEKYDFTWHGKMQSIRIAQTPSMGTLRPCKEESKNWDTTENIYIEGDNLEVLKLLQKSYFGKIKMIYIDPPYNTGNDFVYPDNYLDNIENYLEITGQIDGEGKKVSTNTETNGRYHTDWLNMMYPRLKLARNLLRDDGIILINIDENEMVNLQKICQEIFGEINDLGIIVWDKRNPKGEVKGISYQHEYISVYAKNKDAFFENNSILRPKKNADAMIKKSNKLFSKVTSNFSLEEANAEFQTWLSTQKELSGGERAYNRINENGDLYRMVSMAAPDKPETRSHRPLIHPTTGRPCPVPLKGWRFTDQSMDELLSKGEIIFGIDENTQPTRKYLLKDNMYENLPSLLYYGGSDVDMLNELDIPFDTPKVVDIVKEHIRTFSSLGDIILDFFSGSATTAHAIMQLNAEGEGNRRFVMVQLPELTDGKSEAYRAGYKNICEIGKERIRRAGERIKTEASKQTKLNAFMTEGGGGRAVLGHRFQGVQAGLLQYQEMECRC